MAIVLDGNLGITTPAETVQGALTTTGNTILGDASTDTLNVGNGGLVKDASGNVGIGTASPSAKLNVVTSGGNSRISIGDTAVATYSTVLMYGGNGKYNFQLGAQTNINNAFEITPSTATGGTTFSTPVFVVDSTGNVLVSKTNPDDTTNKGVALYGGSNAGAITCTFDTSVATNTYHLYNKNATNNGYRFYVGANGGINNYSANNSNLSDERVKKDIVNAGNYLNKICAIPVRTFLYKDQSDDDLNIGVIAQEVEAIAPELVSNAGFGDTPEDGVPLKTIYQTDFQYALMKCIQEQQALIIQLQADVAALKALSA